jgi:UDP:flavonoid glycosyltransferase YjiC (YdhE family)
MFMRIVVTAMPVYSHLAPALVPVARAMVRAGHDVRVATGRDLRPVLERAGLPFLELPRAVNAAEAAADPELAASIGMGPGGVPADGDESNPGAAFGRLFGGLYAVRCAEDLLDAVSGWQPELIVREPTALCGYLAAEKLGVPQAVLDIAPLAPSRHPGLVPWLNDSRAKLGLAAAASIDMLDSALWAALLPAQWYPECDRAANRRHYRLDERGAGRLDPDIVELAGDRPLVLAGLGSNSGLGLVDETTLLQRIIDALARVPCTAVVALGAQHDPATWEPTRPSNVHLLSVVPQQLMLRCCEVFITHAGFNGVRESLAEGVPMVAVPLYAEQPANAERIVELGLGVRVSPSDADTDALADAVRQVIDDRRYRYRAQQFQREMLALPDTEQMITDLTME